MLAELIAPLVELACACALAQGTLATAQEPTYGSTPAELRPYRQAEQVFWRFFETAPLFRGLGREKPAPTGLESFKVGLFAPIEGRGEIEIGRSILQAARLAIDEANARGGFAPQVPYELVVRNDAAVWGDSSNTVVDLAWHEEVWAMIGSVDGASTHVALRVALKAEVPMVNTACTDPTLTETAIPWIVRNYPDDRQHGYRLAREVFEASGHERVAVLRSNDKYGRVGVKEFLDAARRLGHPVVVELRYPPGNPDVESQLERIAAVDSDAVVLWGAAADCGRIVARMRELGLRQAVFGNDRLVCDGFLRSAGPAAEGVVATSPLDPDCDAPAWLDFRRRYRDRFGVEPDSFAAFSYDGARMLIAAVERAGANRARIRDELFAAPELPGLLGPIRFDASFTNVGELHLLQVLDGRFRRIPER